VSPVEEPLKPPRAGADKEAMTTTRELDQRQTNGIDVVLLWHTGTDKLTVSVSDASTGHNFEVDVDGANAMDAFHHPYAYAASRGIPYHAWSPSDAALID
jgi:hypothetical protein